MSFFTYPDIAANLYHNRDFRRKYPQTDVITQHYLTELLLASPNEDGTKRYVAHGAHAASLPVTSRDPPHSRARATSTRRRPSPKC